MITRRTSALGRSLFAAALGAVAFASSFTVAIAAQTPAAPPAQGGGGAAPSDDAMKLGSPPALPQGTTQEEMWPAATAEGWAKPVLVRWQRTVDDAFRVARAEHRPILVCVNMDGEIASEHFAGVRYRDPETAARMAPYVTLIASVYRHTPRDHDETGKRVPCPRFGTVTCGEHIEVERELYGKYFEGKRVSPRHIVLDLEGKETFDVYFSWDTRTVLTEFTKGAEGWAAPLPAPERTLRVLAASARSEDREELERMYDAGDREARRAILVELVERPTVDQLEVLRKATGGLDLELAHLGRQALAKCTTDASLDVTADVLKGPVDQGDRELLLRAVAELGKTSSRARTLAALHDGLARSSGLVDAGAAESLAKAYAAGSTRAPDVARVASRAEARPDDGQAKLALAAELVLASESDVDKRHARVALEDARANALAAERAGVNDAKLDGVLAVVASRLGDLDGARRRAMIAVERGLLKLDDGATAADHASGLSSAARVEVLQRFAEARESAIRAAFRSGDGWPPSWLADLNAAYAVISRSPLASVAPIVEYHDFLRWIGATPRANAVLEESLARFPDSADLHERLRARLLWEGGPEALEKDYAARLERANDLATPATQIEWFAGCAALVAAEHHRRRNQLDAATQEYDRALARFAKHGERFPDAKDDDRHYLAHAHAGRARIAMDRGDLATSLDELVTAFTTRPEVAASPDGLGIRAADTARLLEVKLRAAGDEAKLARLKTAMEALDPKLLEPPPSELPQGPDRARRGRDPGPGRR